MWAARALGWGAGVGLVVGLFAPPLLASVVVGGAAGAVVGRFADHQLKTGIRDKIGEALPPGSAGIIAFFDDDQRLALERALPGSRLKSVVQSDKNGLVRGLKASLAEAMGKFSPDRTRLPIGGPGFRRDDRQDTGFRGGLDDQHGAGAAGGRAERAAHADRRLGFGNPGTFGGPVATPNMTRVGERA